MCKGLQSTWTDGWPELWRLLGDADQMVNCHVEEGTWIDIAGCEQWVFSFWDACYLQVFDHKNPSYNPWYIVFALDGWSLCVCGCEKRYCFVISRLLLIPSESSSWTKYYLKHGKSFSLYHFRRANGFLFWSLHEKLHVASICTWRCLFFCQIFPFVMEVEVRVSFLGIEIPSKTGTAIEVAKHAQTCFG